MENNNHPDRRKNGQYYREGYTGMQNSPNRRNGERRNDERRNSERGIDERRNSAQREVRTKRKKRSRIGDVLSSVLMLAALAVFLYSGYTLYGYYRDYKQGTDEYKGLSVYVENDKANEQEEQDALEQGNQQEMTEPETTVIEENGKQVNVPVMDNPVNFDELKKVNEDIVGWLKVRAVDISYPVVQAEDNEYYLHRTFEKTENFAGCLFMNCGNKADLTDQNTIIYGHNMKNGSMFGKLKDFQKEETFDKSEYFWIYTPDRIYQYQIFSAMTVEKTGLTYQTFFTESEFDELINRAFENSVVDNSDQKVENGDRIMTLSTCTGDDATRFVIMGKLVQIFAVRK